MFCFSPEKNLFNATRSILPFELFRLRHENDTLPSTRPLLSSGRRKRNEKSARSKNTISALLAKSFLLSLFSFLYLSLSSVEHLLYLFRLLSSCHGRHMTQLYNGFIPSFSVQHRLFYPPWNQTHLRLHLDATCFFFLFSTRKKTLGFLVKKK